MNDKLNHIEPGKISDKKQEKKIWDLLSEVHDPEVPVLSIHDLGIVRNITAYPFHESWNVEVTITPTYSGCPAMDMIAMNIKMHLSAHGYKSVKIISVLSPAWTTEWMTEDGKNKLKAYGIAAPHKLSAHSNAIECPQCHSLDTRLLSQFGSTACKALYQCND